MEQRVIPVKTSCECEIAPLAHPALVRIWGTWIEVNRVLDSVKNYTVEQDFMTFHYSRGLEIVTVCVSFEEKDLNYLEKLVTASQACAVYLGKTASYEGTDLNETNRAFRTSVLPALAEKGVPCAS